MATNALSLFKANDPYEQLITQLIAIERGPQTELKFQKTEQERLKGVLSDADSKLSALDTVLKRFLDPLSSPFAARSASLADDAGFSVAVGNKTSFGSHTVQVERLARSDTRISKQFGRTDSSLSAFFGANGAQTFSISVANPTDDDLNNRVNIEVTVDPSGTTDEEILKEIGTAINSAMQTAIEAGDIESNDRAYASVVNETTSTTRLSLRSGSTGFTHRLEFTDSAAGLLSLLEVNADALQEGTNGGQVTEVGTNETDSLLNAKVLVDGLTIYRDSNQISDAIEGATLTLRKVMETTEEFTVDTNAEAIRTEIDDFISKYNEILSFISNKSQIDADADIRGDFASDSAFRGLRFSMRNEMVRSVAGQLPGAPGALADIGITIKNDGTLELADEDKLLGAIRNDLSGVEKLFKGPDGYATRLQARVDSFLGVNGLIDKREEVLENKISRLDDRIADWDQRLLRREDQLRQQYARMQEALASLQSQQSAFMQFFGY